MRSFLRNFNMNFILRSLYMTDKTYVLCCDTPADLTADYYAARNIHYLPYRYNLDENVYIDDLVSMPPEKFFKTMEDGAMTTPTNSLNFFLRSSKKVLTLFTFAFLRV